MTTLGANGSGSPSKPNGSRPSSGRRSQDQPPDGIEPGDFAPRSFAVRHKEKTLTTGGCQGLYLPDGVLGFGGHKRRPSSCTNNTAVLPAFRS